MAKDRSEPIAGEWRVFLDVQATRRKITHCLVAPNGETLYWARHLSEILAWLDARAISRYLLVPNHERSLGLPLEPILIEDNEQWPS